MFIGERKSAIIVATFFLLSMIFPLLGSSNLVYAATFTVDSTGDGGDSNPGDAICNDGTGSCTLRAAIEEANSAPTGIDTIDFNILGTGPHTIQPLTALPIVTVPVIIDGYTQPGSAVASGTTPATLMIEIDGQLTAASNGLVIQENSSGGDVIRGLAINRFELNGIRASSRDITIEGNHIGTDISGTVDLGNGQNGIEFYNHALVTSALVGGTSDASRNVISGNDTSGVNFLIEEYFDDVWIYGNYIGVDSSGVNALGNTLNGINFDGGSILGADFFVGNSSSTGRNIISGNLQNGMSIVNDPSDCLVRGNYIGTDITGSIDLGNGADGIYMDIGADETEIGGATTDAGNLIAFNDGNGIFLDTATTIPFSHNLIHSNDELGIDLYDVGDLVNGVTPNDLGDSDTGSNYLQNYPEITDAYVVAGQLYIEGSLNSIADNSYTLQFFYNTMADPSGNGEGEHYIGNDVVTTDSGGDVTFSVNFASVPSGSYITATATREINDTSEFSEVFQIRDGEDSDGDGVENQYDIDDDNDGILDINEGGGLVDSDGDTVVDSLDVDSDGDGIVDNIEAQSEAVTYVPLSGSDSDLDGLDNAYEPDGLSPVDTDSDSTEDYLDSDTDNDTVIDSIEGHDADGNGTPDRFPSGSDTDGDGLDDVFDTVIAPEPTTNSAGTNATLQDTDSDGNRDWRDIDDDGDGVDTEDEDTNENGDATDDDTDRDGTPDYLDTDDDGDGVDTKDEDYNEDGDPTNDDLNNNGIPDYLDPGVLGLVSLPETAIGERSLVMLGFFVLLILILLGIYYLRKVIVLLTLKREFTFIHDYM